MPQTATPKVDVLFKKGAQAIQREVRKRGGWKKIQADGMRKIFSRQLVPKDAGGTYQSIVYPCPPSPPANVSWDEVMGGKP